MLRWFLTHSLSFELGRISQSPDLSLFLIELCATIRLSPTAIAAISGILICTIWLVDGCEDMFVKFVCLHSVLTPQDDAFAGQLAKVEGCSKYE